MTREPEVLRRHARAWAQLDPEPVSRRAIEGALADDDLEALDAWFGRRLDFGTAGVRGPVGPGPNRMNRVVVRQTAAGFGRWLGQGAFVVVGYDGRADSVTFADDAARALAGAGCEVAAFVEPVPTPLLAFAVERLAAAGGLMVTASHNPPTDNGMKLFGPEGSQLVPADEVAVSAEINLILSEGGAPPLSDESSSEIAAVGPGVRRAYVSSVVGQTRAPERRRVRAVHTSLHGVAGPYVVDAFAQAGFDAPLEVAEQATPDPSFPTVERPNPEEPASLEMAVARAQASEADLVLASDPDGDRLAVAVPDADGWRPLTGTETAALLADHILEHTSGSARMVVGTVTGTQLLRRQAAAAGVYFEETPPGFKWLVQPIGEHPDRRFVFAFEEAMGFLVGRTPRDKDGVSAALLMAEAAAVQHDRGRTLADRLFELVQEHGLTHVDPLVVRLADTPDPRGALDELMALVRERLGSTFGGVGIERVRDLRTDPCRVPIDCLLVDLTDRSRLIIRPSGTEPILKFTVELTIDGIKGRTGVVEAREGASARAGELKQAFAGLLR